MANYRDKYKAFFGIDFNRNLEVHHIDFNRENNSIDNLVAIPRIIHNEYHRIMTYLSYPFPFVGENVPNGFVDLRISSPVVMFYLTELEALLPILTSCWKWIAWKRDGYAMSLLNIFSDDIEKYNIDIKKR